jgi:hypothetical protein
VRRVFGDRPLEGWQPAVVLVAFVALVAALVVPRPVEPEGDLPEPNVDPRALAKAMAADDGLAASAERDRLDVDVRELGTAYRAYGRVDRAGRPEDLPPVKKAAAEAAARALERGEAEVARLRAYEERQFLREVRRWESTGEESDELVELGGGFLNMLHRTGWVLEPPVAARRRVLIDDAALRVVFKKRWNEVAGLEGGALALKVDEERALYRFLLRHPPSQDVTPALPDAPAAADEGHKVKPDDEADPLELRRRALVERYRLRKIDELARVDPGYPARLAKGMLMYRLGRYGLAVELLREHLEAKPDGPFALRATNYLRAALGRAAEP